MTRTIPVFNMTIGAFLVRFTLVFIVVIWTIPAFGLLISSLRDKEQLALTGWWSALSTTESSDQARTGIAEDQIERDGMYVIEGNIFENTSSKTVMTFGGSFLGGEITDHQPGDVVELDDGTTFTLDVDGNYQYISETEFDLERGGRFFYNASSPPRFTLDNYDEILSSEGMDRAFLNTFTVTIPATIIPIAIAAFAAYAFAWMDFPGRQILFVVVVGLLVVPLQMSLIPLLRLYNGVGIARTYPGIWLAHTGFGLPLAVYLLRSYIGGLPRDIIESAKIDGASHFQTFVRLILPLSIPALASFAIFQFLWVWNDLLVALVFLGKQPDQIVMTSKIQELLGSRGENWEILTSSAFVSIAVPLIVFFSLQRYFVRGLLAGSVKGG